MKRRRPLLLAASLFLLAAGLLALLAPYAGEVAYRHWAAKTIARYEQQAAEADDSLLARLKAEADAYNRRLFQTGQEYLTDSRSYEEMDFPLDDYGFDDNLFGYISIPALETKLPLYLGASTHNLNRGAALLSQTSLPVGGSSTNAVIAAHRGTALTNMLRDIQLLQPGDSIFITTPHGTLQYIVAESQIIDPANRAAILIQPGRDLLTLVTCHPQGSDAQRYVVYCERAI